VTSLRLLILACIALFPLASTIHAGDLSDHIVFEQGETLYGRIGSAGQVEKLSDRAHYEKVDRDGRHWYVLHRSDSQRAWLKILECDSTGALQMIRTVTDPKLQETTAIDQAQFLSDGRLFVVLHVNPSLGAAVALNCKTGERAVFFGHTFTPDSSGQHIAYLRDEDVGSGESDMTELWVDGKKACQLPAAQANGISWTANGTAVAR
jgi:hypothetical protein